MAAAPKKSTNDLELIGRTVKHHIAAAARHEKGVRDHETAAGALLNEARNSVQHGEWQAWLDEHGIPHSTARRLLAEYADPHKAEARRAANAASMLAERVRKREEAENAHTCERSEHKPPRSAASNVVPTYITSLTRRVKSLTEDQAAQVAAFLDTLTE